MHVVCGCRNPFEAVHQLRLDTNICFTPITDAIDSREYVVQESARTSEHVVIVRIHLRPGTLLPKLPQSSRARLKHEAESGIVLLRENFEGKVGLSARGQCRKQILGA